MNLQIAGYVLLSGAAGALYLVAASPVLAQAPAASASYASAPLGNMVAGSATGHVLSIDAPANSVTIGMADGRQLAVDVDPAVGDVKRLKVGDEVDMQYRGALLLSAQKVDSKGVRSRVEKQAISPASGGVSAQVRQIDVVATVQHVDRKHHQVTLRGPEHTVTLQVAPEVPLDRLKPGDSVQARYTAATAVEVTRNGQLLR